MTADSHGYGLEALRISKRRGSVPVPKVGFEPSRRRASGVEISRRRVEEVYLPPEALAELYNLHEAFCREHRSSQPNDTSAAALKAIWRQTTWMACGELSGPREEALHVRNVRVAPANDAAEAQFKAWKDTGAAVNTKGRKSETDASIGQDNCSVSQLSDGWQLMCVMDGHGPKGHWPATRAVQTVPFFLEAPSCKTMLKQGQVEAAILHAFKNVQKDIEDRSVKDYMDLQVAGSTAVAALRHPNKDKIWIGTCGDSRAIMFLPGEKAALHSTVDHTPACEKEKERVEKCGAEVIRKEYADGVVDERIVPKGKGHPAYGFTRGLGDLFMKSYGVTAEPEVVEWQTVPGAMLFIATDGVWEFFTNPEVVQVLSSSLLSGETPVQACMLLLEFSRQAWRKNEGVYCDDITMILSPAGPAVTQNCIPSHTSTMDYVCAWRRWKLNLTVVR